MHKFKLVPMLLMIFVLSSSIGGKEELKGDTTAETVVAVNPQEAFGLKTEKSTMWMVNSSGTWPHFTTMTPG